MSKKPALRRERPQQAGAAERASSSAPGPSRLNPIWHRLATRPTSRTAPLPTEPGPRITSLREGGPTWLQRVPVPDESRPSGTAEGEEEARIEERPPGTGERPEAESTASAPASPGSMATIEEESTIRVIESVAGMTPTGDRTNLATAVETFRQNQGLGPGSVLDEATVEAMFAELVGKGWQEYALALVMDYYDVDASNASTVYFNYPLTDALSRRVEVGGLISLAVGRKAFTTAVELRELLEGALQGAAPTGPTGPAGDLLTPRQETRAIKANQDRLDDPRAIKAIQGLVGAATTGGLDADTIERVAGLQQSHGRTADGIIDTGTLAVLVDELAARDSHDAAIVLVIDYYDLGHGALLEIHYDPALLSAHGRAEYHELPGPTIIRIGPGAFRGLAELVHTIAHELEHVRQFSEVTPGEVGAGQGLGDNNVREFLGEALEILSRDMPTEPIDGFMRDAKDAIGYWKKIGRTDRVRLWDRFVSVRKAVVRRFNRAGPMDKAKHRATYIRFLTEPEP